MTIDQLPAFLAWCTGIHYAILLVWFGVFALAHDGLYRLHTRWFRLSVETFDALNDLGVAIYRIGTLLFFVVPLIALCLVGSGS